MLAGNTIGIKRDRLFAGFRACAIQASAAATLAIFSADPAAAQSSVPTITVSGPNNNQGSSSLSSLTSPSQGDNDALTPYSLTTAFSAGTNASPYQTGNWVSANSVSVRTDIGYSFGDVKISVGFVDTSGTSATQAPVTVNVITGIISPQLLAAAAQDRLNAATASQIATADWSAATALGKTATTDWSAATALGKTATADQNIANSANTAAAADQKIAIAAGKMVTAAQNTVTQDEAAAAKATPAKKVAANALVMVAQKTAASDLRTAQIDNATATNAENLAAAARTTATNAQNLATAARATATNASNLATAASATATNAQNLVAAARTTATNAGNFATASWSLAAAAQALALKPVPPPQPYVPVQGVKTFSVKIPTTDAGETVTKTRSYYFTVSDRWGPLTIANSVAAVDENQSNKWGKGPVLLSGAVESPLDGRSQTASEVYSDTISVGTQTNIAGVNLMTNIVGSLSPRGHTVGIIGTVQYNLDLSSLSLDNPLQMSAHTEALLLSGTQVQPLNGPSNATVQEVGFDLGYPFSVADRPFTGTLFVSGTNYDSPHNSSYQEGEVGLRAKFDNLFGVDAWARATLEISVAGTDTQYKAYDSSAYSRRLGANAGICLRVSI